MRITHNMMAEANLRNLNISSERLEALQNQLSSGKRISKPSDDPVAVAAALGFRTELNKTDQYEKNIDSASSWLNTTDTALDSVNKLLLRAQELAVTGANDTLSADDRQAMANEVSQILEQAVVASNSTYGDQYVFAGQKTTTAPYTLNAGPPITYAYSGDTGPIVREIGVMASMTVNSVGSAVFPPVFDALIALKNGLEASDTTAIQNSLTQLQQANQGVLSERARVGAKVNRLEVAQSRLEDIRLNISGMLSKQEDADMTEVITKLSLAENVYKAALATGAHAIQPSLLDFLK